MQLNTHLNFNGQCETAFRFYEQCFGAKIETMLTYAGTPMEKHVPPEWHDKVLHATLTGNGVSLMGADSPPGRYEKPTGFMVALHFNDAAEAERIFQALSEDGAVQMPLQKTFWASRFGMLTDRFGIPWMINCA
jgi:PhnB protein